MQKEALQSINNRLGIQVEHTSLEFTDYDEGENEGQVSDTTDTDFDRTMHFVWLYNENMRYWYHYYDSRYFYTSVNLTVCMNRNRFL